MPGLLTEITREDAAQKERSLRRLVAALTFLQREDIKNPREVIVRDILPADDLTSGSDNAWTTAVREWEQDLSGGADANAQAYQIDSDGNAQNKVIAFLRVANQTLGTTQAREVLFRLGTSGLQGIKDQLQIQGMQSNEVVAAYLAEPVIYLLNEDGDIAIWMDADNVEQLVFEGVVGEKVGETISTPMVNPLITSADEAQRVAGAFLETGQAGGQVQGQQARQVA